MPALAPKIPIPEREAEERVKDFKEVNLGYGPDQAIAEASRCLQCPKPKCVEGCPVNINIPRFIKLVKEEKPDKALKVIKRTNNLPGVCGRVCPQEDQCEGACILSAQKRPIGIGYLERYASDHPGEEEIPKPKKNGKKVAIVGSGPAGLTCAADLVVLGYKVTIFEALHDTGGVLRYGIPNFRLPKDIVEKEVEYIEKLGVEILKNKIIGKIFTVDELLEKYDAVFIGSGAGLPYFMNIPGENLVGVYSANEFLTRVNLMRANEFPKYKTPVKIGERVVVVGGGNVAIDAARVSRRLGSHVTVVYRRSIDEMPARAEEVKHAKEEGIKFLMLTNPSRIIGLDKVEGVECVQMMLGDEDNSGRRRPLPIEGSEFIVDCDQVIVAVGQGPNPLLLRTLNVNIGNQGNIVVDENMMSSSPGVFAGGDAVSGAATVIAAMGDGKKAAKAIDGYIMN